MENKITINSEFTAKEQVTNKNIKNNEQNNQNSQNNQNNLNCEKHLAFLYKKIASISDLLWSHENHLIGNRLRSDPGFSDKELNWKNNQTCQIGYGEITMVIYYIIH